MCGDHLILHELVTHHLHLPALHVLDHEVEDEVLGGGEHQRGQLLPVHLPHQHHPAKNHLSS